MHIGKLKSQKTNRLKQTQAGGVIEPRVMTVLQGEDPSFVLRAAERLLLVKGSELSPGFSVNGR